MSIITQKSPAKINLFLHILGKRDDGYHNLQTVFRLINFYDTLTFTTNQCQTNQQFPVNLINAHHITENPTDNLIVKASLALLNFVKQQGKFHQDFIEQLPIIDIHLDKKIPMGAGLGGGSSNCATTLMVLNDIWQLQLTQQELRQIGATLGADVPIFIFGQDAIAEGIGEILTPIQLAPQRLLLVTPNVHINTKQLFANDQLKRDCPLFSHAFLQENSEKFTNHLTENFHNVFEPVVKSLSKDVDKILKQLQNFANISQTTPRMTGSGSCLFLPLPMSLTDSQIIDWQQQMDCPSYMVETIG